MRLQLRVDRQLVGVQVRLLSELVRAVGALEGAEVLVRREVPLWWQRLEDADGGREDFSMRERRRDWRGRTLRSEDWCARYGHMWHACC